MSQLTIQTVYQGDSVVLDFECIEPDGSRANLTDSDVRWGLADPDDPSSAVLEKSIDDGITLLDPTQGVCRVNIAAGDLTDAGTFLHELEVTASGQTFTYGQGLFIVKPTVYPT